MKKFWTIILSLVLALCLVCGCTETTPSGGSSGSSSGSADSGTSSGGTTDADDDSEEMTDDSYTVTLQFPTTTTVTPSLEGIYAVWSNDNSVYTAEFNSSGVAYYNGLDGEYTVTLSSTPDGYTYNPNIYEADGGVNGRNVSIYMYALSSFTGGEGYSLDQTVIAKAADGSSNDSDVYFRVYRIYFYTSGTEFYFEFTPQSSGTYSIETYVSVYDNNVNPTLTRYTFSSHTSMGSYTSGGESGTYTKNVRYEYSIADSQVGNRGYYGVKIDCASGTYPQYVDIAITWEDYYTDEDMYAQYGGAYQMVEVPDISTDWTTPSGVYTMLRTSSLMDGDFSTTITINNTRYTQIYKWTDGFYYYCKDPVSYYAATGGSVDESDEATFDTYWTLLFVQIKDTALFTVSGSSILGLLQTKELGYMYRVSVKVNGVYKNYNYYNMLVAYQAAANSNSCYPVTEQLKECLQNVSITNTYFYDGNGWLEGSPFNYSANDEDQWLYGCGVYI